MAEISAKNVTNFAFYGTACHTLSVSESRCKFMFFFKFFPSSKASSKATTAVDNSGE